VHGIRKQANDRSTAEPFLNPPGYYLGGNPVIVGRSLFYNLREFQAPFVSNIPPPVTAMLTAGCVIPKQRESSAWLIFASRTPQ